MQNVRLSKEQVDELIRDNRYQIAPDSLNVPELSFLTDAESELALLNKAADEFAFTIDQEEAKQILDNIIGPVDKKEDNIQFGGAVLIVEGGYSLDPVFTHILKGQQSPIRMHIYHKSVIDRRHRAISHQFIEHATVEFLTVADEEYIYQILATSIDDFIFEEIAKKASGLPIYEVSFNEEGNYKLTQLNDLV